LGSGITYDEKWRCGIKCRIGTHKKKAFYHQTELKLRKETKKSATFGAWLCMVIKLGHFGK
jgi:hypothetical protein